MITHSPGVDCTVIQYFNLCKSHFVFSVAKTRWSSLHPKHQIYILPNKIIWWISGKLDQKFIFISENQLNVLLEVKHPPVELLQVYLFQKVEILTLILAWWPKPSYWTQTFLRTSGPAVPIFLQPWSFICLVCITRGKHIWIRVREMQSK